MYRRALAVSFMELLESRTFFTVTTFTIDPTLSTIRLSGKVADVFDIDEQHSGSLIQNYQGSIVADVQDSLLSFPGGSSVIAQATKNYDPGTGPANYGMKGETGGLFSIKLGEAAIRNFAFDLKSTDLALSDAGAFGANGLDVLTTGGTLQYDLRVGGDGESDLDDKDADNAAAGNATLRGDGDNRTLTVPIDFSFDAGSTNLRFRGTIVATTGSGAPIDPNVVRIGAGTLLKTVQFTEADGTLTTITLTGDGSADVRFVNATQQTPGKTGTTIVNGSGVELLGIDVTGSTTRTKLLASGKGGTDGVGIVKAITTDGSMASIGGRGVLLADDINVSGTLGSVTASRMLNADIAADSIGTIKVAGEVAVSTVTPRAPFAAGQFALRSFTSGDFINSRISAVGAIGNVKVKSMTFSEIHSGVTNADVDFPTTSDLSADGAIGNVTIKTFSGSAIAADTLGRLKFGTITTANAGDPFGITADVIGGLQASNESRQRLKLGFTDDPASLAAQLAAQSFATGDFVIRLV